MKVVYQCCYGIDVHKNLILKNCVAKQRISLGSVQTAIDNNLITLPGWDGY